MDPELTEAELVTLNKIVDDVEKLNQQMKRFAESMAESSRIQAAYKAPSMEERLERIIERLATMMPTPKSEPEQYTICFDAVTESDSNVQMAEDDILITNVSEVGMAPDDVIDNFGSAVATGVFDLRLEVSPIDSNQAEVIYIHSSSMIALSKKEIQNDKYGLEFGNKVYLQSWCSPQPFKRAPIDFKSVLLLRVDDIRHESEEFESGTIISRSLNFCTEPVRQNVCEIFPFLLPPEKPPDECLSLLGDYNIWCCTKYWHLALSSIQQNELLVWTAIRTCASIFMTEYGVSLSCYHMSFLSCLSNCSWLQFSRYKRCFSWFYKWNCVIICFEQFSDHGGSDLHSAWNQKFAHTANILVIFAHQFVYLSYIDIGIQVKRRLLMEHFSLMRCDFHLEQGHCEADVVTTPIVIFTLHGKPRNRNIGGVQNGNHKGSGIDASWEKIAASTHKGGWALQGIDVSKAFGEMIVVFRFVDENFLNNCCSNLWLKNYGMRRCLSTFCELILRVKELHFDFPRFSHKTMVFEFSVKSEQKLECDCGYLKLLTGDNDQKDFDGHTLYNIMLESDANIVYITSVFDLFYSVCVEMLKLARVLFLSIHNDETTGNGQRRDNFLIKFILFVPRRAPFGILDIHKKMNIIKLYVSRFLVMDNCERLTPKCSGFIKAVENSDHLFLSILRHILSMSKMECQNDTYSMTNESKEAVGKSQRLEKLNKNGDAVLIMLDMRYEYEFGIGRFGTTFHSASFGAFVVRYINNFFMFSLPRPPEIASFWLPLSFWFSSPRPPEVADLEDKVDFKEGGMLRTGIIENIKDAFVF